MKFSVLLPTRNRLELLARAIETVRRQDHDDWEILVSDNNSEEDVAGHVRAIGDPRILYFRTDSFIPVTANWNNALEHASGDYFIMLGDDDGLMPRYFSTLREAFDKFGAPDFAYTGAFLYAYPGVMPGSPDGFLRSYGRQPIFQGKREPFWLERSKALGFVRDSLSFRARFDYNMQFSLVSRSQIERMRPYGKFFQSPYPDYYASNALMLKAERILVVPAPLVTIGISPKSFGYFYFNDAEGAGNAFLNNLPDQDMVRRLQRVILPGSAMNTSWLIAMETLAVNYPGELPVGVDYARYRLIQSFATFAGLLDGSDAGNVHRKLLAKLRPREWLRYGLFLSAIARMAPRRLRAGLARQVRAASGSHSSVPMPEVSGTFRTILDVFEQVDPGSQSGSTSPGAPR